MIGASPIRAVLFDWGDTLFESPHAPTVIQSAARAAGVGIDDAEARRVWDELWDAGKTAEEHAKGRDLSREAHRRVWTELFSRANARVPGIDRGQALKDGQRYTGFLVDRNAERIILKIAGIDTTIPVPRIERIHPR